MNTTHTSTSTSKIAIAAITSLLDLANGKRRTRTLDMDAVRYAIGEALADGYSSACGGTVPNAYKYPAQRTIATAIASKSVVVVRVAEVNAKKNSGTGLPWRRNANPDHIADQIAAKTAPEATLSPDEVRMSRSTAERIAKIQEAD